MCLFYLFYWVFIFTVSLRENLEFWDGKKMWAQSIILILLPFLALCVVASETDNVKIDNLLSACVSITHAQVTNKQVAPMLTFELDVLKPISECGCKSALGSYVVYFLGDGYESYLLGGKVGLVKPGYRNLPLAAEKNLIYQKQLNVRFSCAQPD